MLCWSEIHVQHYMHTILIADSWCTDFFFLLLQFSWPNWINWPLTHLVGTSKHCSVIFIVISKAHSFFALTPFLVLVGCSWWASHGSFQNRTSFRGKSICRNIDMILYYFVSCPEKMFPVNSDSWFPCFSVQWIMICPFALLGAGGKLSDCLLFRHSSVFTSYLYITWLLF